MSRGSVSIIRSTHSVATNNVFIPLGSSIQPFVNANPVGTTFILAGGTYRLNSVIPKNNMRFTGNGHAGSITNAEGMVWPAALNPTILNGSSILTGFTQTTNGVGGTVWSVGGQSQQNQAQAPSVCLAAFPGCYHSEDLFFDNVLKQHMETLAAVGPGKWWFDYTNHIIYVGDNPAGHTVETSVAFQAFSGTATGVIIEQLTVEKYATIIQRGAIDSSVASGWIVRDVTARWNHGVGVYNGPGSIMQRVGCTDNGQMGTGGTGLSPLVQDIELARNDTVGVDPGFEAGGGKFTNTDGLMLRRIYSHDNIQGNGLWADISTIRTTYEDNYTLNNPGAGIFHEISYDAVMRRNISRNNGFQFLGYVWGGGIMTSSSGGSGQFGGIIELYDNIVDSNKQGITTVEQDRSTDPMPFGPLQTRSHWIHDNTVIVAALGTEFTGGVTGYAAGMAEDNGDTAVFNSAVNRWERNTYILPSPTTEAAWPWNNAAHTFSEWQGFGLDVTGTAASALVAPTIFGQQLIGTTSATQTSGWRWGNVYPCLVSGTLTTFHFYCSGGASDQLFVPTIYNYQGGVPTTLLASAAPVTVHAGDVAQWYTATISAPVVANQRYLVGVVGGGTGFQAQMFYFDQTSQSFFSPNAGGNTPDSNWGPLPGGGISGQRWSFYVTGTAPASPSFASGISANGRFLVDQHGAPMLMVQAAEATWTNISAAAAQSVMATRASQGFNWEQLIVIGNQGSDSTTGTPDWATFDNIVPFFQADGVTLGTGPANYDVTKPNEPYWARIDAFFAAAQANGITLLVSLLGDPVWHDSPGFYAAQGTTKLASFATWFTNRYRGNFYHHLWGYDHFFSIPWATYDPFITTMMNAVKATNSSLMHTIENNDGLFTDGTANRNLTSDDTAWSIGRGAATASQMNLNLMYDARDNSPDTVRAYNTSPTIPTFFGEGLYENSTTPKNTWSNLLNRKYFYLPIINGACGTTYGHDITWHFGTGYAAALTTTAVTHIGIWKTFMNSIAWYNLAPDFNKTFVTNFNTYSAGVTGTNAAITPDGSLGIAYNTTLGGTITVHGASMRGNFLARWFDPTNGAYTPISTFSNTGTMNFTVPGSPGSNAAGDPDWVLVLTA